MSAQDFAIPEIEADLSEFRKTAWTPEIDEILRKYYSEYAAQRKAIRLLSIINKKYDTKFSPRNFYARIRHLELSGPS